MPQCFHILLDNDSHGLSWWLRVPSLVGAAVPLPDLAAAVVAAAAAPEAAAEGVEAEAAAAVAAGPAAVAAAAVAAETT